MLQTSVSLGNGWVSTSSVIASTFKGFLDKSSTSSVWEAWSQAEGTLSASMLSFEGSSGFDFESSGKETDKIRKIQSLDRIDYHFLPSVSSTKMLAKGWNGPL